VSLSRTEAGRCVLSTRLVELNRVIYWRVTADVSPDFGQVSVGGNHSGPLAPQLVGAPR
jgi:hypothetical protein